MATFPVHLKHSDPGRLAACGCIPALLTRKVYRVTCKGCQRTYQYRQGILDLLLKTYAEKQR